MNPDEREFLRIVFFVSLGLSAIASGVAGSLIGLTNGRRKEGFFWGLFLGPLGWFIMLTLADVLPKCEECLGPVHENARKCKNCGSKLVLVDDERTIKLSIGTDFVWIDIIIVIVILLIIIGSLRARG